MSRVIDEFIALPEPIQAAICGANARHVALIENAFSVLIETPGGGLALRGAAKSLRWLLSTLRPPSAPSNGTFGI